MRLIAYGPFGDRKGRSIEEILQDLFFQNEYPKLQSPNLTDYFWKQLTL